MLVNMSEGLSSLKEILTLSAGAPLGEVPRFFSTSGGGDGSGTEEIDGPRKFPKGLDASQIRLEDGLSHHAESPGIDTIIQSSARRTAAWSGACRRGNEV
jgi:hypothetical protein